MDPDLKARVQAEAKARGQTLRVFAERAFEAALEPTQGASTRQAVAERSNGRGEATTGHAEDPAGRGHALADPGSTPHHPSPPRASRKPSTQRVHSARCTCAICKPPKASKAKA